MTTSPVAMVEHLIGFPTVSRDSNLDLIEFVRAYLGDQGVASHLVHDDSGRKANLYATIGPPVAGGVVLSGHTDVVPVDGQQWTGDPFRLRCEDGRLYGRGTADMKSFAAIALALVPDMLAAAMRHPIHLALSYDEEVGCLGAPRMIDEIVANVPPPRAVIVGEPTDMKVVSAHKGIIGVRTSITGHSVHSCQVDRGVSAVHTGARLISYLDDLMRANAEKAEPNNPFDPPFTTVHCGMIEGGTAHNIVAKDCTFTTDIRTIPGEDPRQYLARYEEYVRSTIEPAMRRIAPDAGIRLETASYVPGLREEDDGEAERIARVVTGDNSTNVVSYSTEAGQFQDAGLSVVVCGPGSIDQAHQPDEYIELAQVAAGVKAMRALMVHLS